MDGVGPAAAFDLGGFLAREELRVERAMAQAAATVAAGAVPALAAPLLYALGTRGKRLRPILCCAAFRAASGAEPPGPVYRLACATEWVHTYSLVHDDLPCMDDDDVRRGRPTVHRVYPTRLAVLAGAALLPLAVGLLDREAAALGLPTSERAALVGDLCRAAGAQGMVGGQLLDLVAEEQPPDARGLERIHRAKTGALLAASLRLGAAAARAQDALRAALTTYGEALGLAFQIVDDLLDVTGDSAALGKTAGRDAALGKATYPACYGVHGAWSLARARVGEALAALDDAGVASPELRALAGYVLERRR